MNLIEIDDPSDPRLADYVSLRDAQLRTSLEAEHGIYIAEGEKIIRRALQAGHTPRSLLLAPKWLAGLSDLLDEVSAPIYLAPATLAERVTGFHVHRGALAAMARPPAPSLAPLLTADRLVVVEDIVDHQNLGAIVRCAAGLGWAGVVLSAGCADPYYRRAIKASMGTVFDLDWCRLPAGDQLEHLTEAGFELAALALTPHATPLDDYAAQVRARPRKLALVLGTEGHGLSEGWLSRADRTVVVPMHGGVDSLNVAAAAAIGCYALAG